jgi:hypothetical protein
MVLFMQPEPNDWQNKKNLTPLVIRIMQLPPSIGDTDSHGSHGEQVGLCLTYEAVPLGYPIINVNDSTVARSNFLSLRDKTWNSDRNKIRDVLSGNSKHLSARLERQLEMHEKEPEGRFAAAAKDQEVKLKEFKEDAENESYVSWKSEYGDTHPRIALIKVASHQLNPKFTKDKENKKPTLEPNTIFVVMNQHADNAATYAMNNLKTKKFGLTISANFPSPSTPVEAPLGLRFCIRIEGKTCDSNTSKSIAMACTKEYYQKACLPAKQGVCMRFMPQCSQSIELIPRENMLRKGLFHALKTHTRGTHKGKRYRIQNFCLRWGKMEYLDDEKKREEIRTSKSEYEYLKDCPFCSADPVERRTLASMVLFMQPEPNDWQNEKT